MGMLKAFANQHLLYLVPLKYSKNVTFIRILIRVIQFITNILKSFSFPQAKKMRMSLRSLELQKLIIND